MGIWVEGVVSVEFGVFEDSEEVVVGRFVGRVEKSRE